MESLNNWVGKEMYVERKMSISAISKELGIPLSTVRFRLHSLGVLRSRRDAIALGASQGIWAMAQKGMKKPMSDTHRNNVIASNKARSHAKAKGESVKPNGYIEYTRGANKGRAKHVVAMEKAIGRRINRNECVHHIDENKRNNSIENLRLMTRAEHARLHAIENANKRERDSNGRFC